MQGKLWIVVCLCCCLPAWGLSHQEHLQRLAKADQLLTRAEQNPAQATALVRQAAELVPAGACPSLQRATNNPTSAQVQRAHQEVSALQRAAALKGASGAAAPVTAHAKLDRVLARGEFQALKKNIALPSTWRQRFAFQWNKFWGGFQSVMNKFGFWFGNLLRKLFGNIQFTPRANNMNFGWLAKLTYWLRIILLYIVLPAAVLFLLGLLVSRIMAWHRRRGIPEARQALEERDPTVRRRQEPSYWERSLHQAEELWQQGNQREALRILHRACLVLLDARGILRFDETRANGEVLRELRRLGRSGVHEHLRPIVRGFDRSWYGYLEVPTDEFKHLLECSHQFRESVVGES
ncbi:MAG: hypothetical protein ACYDBB_10875 [Armatimonadota bacterium]